jgi:hypothetical protein
VIGVLALLALLELIRPLLPPYRASPRDQQRQPLLEVPFVVLAALAGQGLDALFLGDEAQVVLIQSDYAPGVGSGYLPSAGAW